MKELSARVGFSEVVLTALGGEPEAALAQAHSGSTPGARSDAATG
jgi:hypothetical protein